MTTMTAQRLLMRAAIAALAALFAQTASAQLTMPGLDLNPDSSRRYTPEEKEKMQEIDKNYKATMKKVPDKQKAYDPWAGARQDSSNAPTTKR